MYNVWWLTSVVGRTLTAPGPPQLLLFKEIAGRFTAGEMRAVSQQLGHTLELNWQFVIVIALTPRASGERRNQQRRVPQEINSKAPFFPPPLYLFPSLSQSPWPLVSCSLQQVKRFILPRGWPISLFSTLRALFLITGPLLLLSPTRWHLTWRRFPLSKEWNHLSGNGLKPSTMADWRLVFLLEASHPLLHAPGSN